MSSPAWNILLVEADDTDAAAVQLMFKQANNNATITHVRSFREANQIVTGFESSFDCALIDYLAPGGNASDLVLNERMLAVPSIMLSWINDDEISLRAIRAGFQDCLYKADLSQEKLMRAILFAIERNKIRQKLTDTKVHLEHLVRVDPLTGILNRLGLEQVIKTLDYENSEHAIILLDVDDFKSVNDQFGYIAGDAVLKALADKLTRVIRDGDDAARIGGDEFMILLRNQTKDQGLVIAERLRNWFAETLVNTTEGHEISVTISLGVAAVTSASNVNDLLKLTQKALHSSKREGKNSVTAKPTSIPPPPDPEDADD